MCEYYTVYLQMIKSDSCTKNIVINADQVRQLRLHFNTSTFISEAKSSLLSIKNNNHLLINSSILIWPALCRKNSYFTMLTRQDKDICFKHVQQTKTFDQLEK